MAVCKTEFCEEEGKIDGFCMGCRMEASRNGTELKEEKVVADPVCQECGKRRSEVDGWVNVRGRCKRCDGRLQYHEKYKAKGKTRKPGKPGKSMITVKKQVAVGKKKPVSIKPALEAPPMADPVNHPAHYTRGKIEVIDFIEDQDLGYHDGNVIKYICRHLHKGEPLKDLQKARWYLERLIEKVEGGVNV